MAGVKDVRAAVEQAQTMRRESGRRTVLFLDEVHRFNKAQQDAFLPFVEDGTVCFIGATTENPSFEINSALLSRARVYVLRALTFDDIVAVLQRALDREYSGVDAVTAQPEALATLARAADGDARRATEPARSRGRPRSSGRHTWPDHRGDRRRGVRRWLPALRQEGRAVLRPDLRVAQIRARHRSGRGVVLAVPDARWRLRSALHRAPRAAHGLRRYRQRRPARAHARVAGCEAYERLGSPEGELAFAQAVVFMACAAKSNAVYVAFNAAMADAQRLGTLDVPMHLRNAPTRLMKGLGYGKGYRYAHDEPDAYAAGETYFPEGMEPRGTTSRCRGVWKSRSRSAGTVAVEGDCYN